MNKNAMNLQVLKDIVGVEQFIAIAEQLNGEHIVFNNYTCQGFVSKEKQNAAIKKDFYHGMSVDELAKKYDMTVSNVYKITSSSCPQIRDFT